MTVTRALMSVALVATLAAAPLAQAVADPPRWAPAHGHRDKHGHHKHGNKHRHVHTDVVVVERYVVVEPRTRVVTCDRPTISRDLVGGTLGGALGGLIGSRFGQGQGKIVAAVGGTILGVFAGQHVARSIDWADEACAQRALEVAETGQPIAWQDPDAGAYQITPTRTWQSGGAYCREYTAQATVGGSPAQMYGTACRQPDGTWRFRS
jgi:surface antigen